MKIRDRYPIVVTEYKVACRDFWQRYFGLDVLFDSDWFVLLGDAQQGSVVAFMSPDHPSAPPGPDTFSGLGMCLEIEVEDARQALADFQSRGGRWRTRSATSHSVSAASACVTPPDYGWMWWSRLRRSKAIGIGTCRRCEGGRWSFASKAPTVDGKAYRLSRCCSMVKTCSSSASRARRASASCSR